MPFPGKTSVSLVLVSFALLWGMPLNALEQEKNAVFTKIIDTGAGLATITRMPDNYIMIYDSGHWKANAKIMGELAELVPRTGKMERYWWSIAADPETPFRPYRFFPTFML